MKTIKRIHPYLLVLLMVLSVAYPQTTLYNVYGWFPFGVTTAASNAAANWYAIKWTPTVSGTATKVRTFVNAVTGTIGSSDLECDFYSDSAGVPGSSLATSTTVTAAPTVASWVEWTGYSFSYTAYTTYWLVFKNNNGTPASNNVAWRVRTESAGGTTVGPTPPAQKSTNSGSTWATVATGTTGIFTVESSGAPTFTGQAAEMTNTLTAISTNYRLGNGVKQGVGVKFTTPANGKMNVKAVYFSPARANTPTGNLSARIYLDSDGSTVATSDSSYTPTQIDTVSNRWAPFYFTSAVTLLSSTTYRVGLIEGTNSDAATIYYSIAVTPYQTDSNSLSLLPFNGTLRGAYCASTCGTTGNWTADSANIPIFGLALDPGGEFASTGGGGTRVYSHR